LATLLATENPRVMHGMTAYQLIGAVLFHARFEWLGSALGDSHPSGALCTSWFTSRHQYGHSP